MLRQLTTLEPPPTPQASFCTINKWFANHYLELFRDGACICGNAQRVIYCKSCCDSANASLGDCDLSAHDAQGQWPGLKQGAEKKEDKHVGEAGGELWLESVGGTHSTTEKPKEKESNLVNI